MFVWKSLKHFWSNKSDVISIRRTFATKEIFGKEF